MASKILESCSYWLPFCFVAPFLFRSGCTGFDVSESNLSQSNCVVALVAKGKAGWNFPRSQASGVVFTVWIKMLIPCVRLFETILNYNFISKQGLIWRKTPVKDLLTSPKNKLSLGLLHKENYVSQPSFSWAQIMLCLNLNSIKESLSYSHMDPLSITPPKPSNTT